MKIVIDWNEYIQWCKKAANYIRETIKNYDYVYGIPRGGLIPATIMSYQLNIPILTTEGDLLGAIHADHKRVVIVDDILDSGKTFDKLWDKIEVNKSLDTSNIFGMFILNKEKAILKCEYTSIKTCPDIWIEFPYETGATDDTISIVKPPE